MDNQKQFSYKITPTGWIVLSFVFLVIIMAGIMFYLRYRSGGLDQTKAEWQAVFLSNGQIYFGQVVNENEDSLIIRDIYYLQDITNLHQGTQQSEIKDFSLIKLGSEIHGPYDEMRINRQHILLVEDLKDDSKVVQAIKRYQASKD